jgi:pilus assembly protein CpaB
MDRKKLVLLLGALIVAIGTALAARSMFAGAATPTVEAAAPAPAEVQGPKVLVAKRALPVGTIITADAIGFQLWPQEMVQDAYFIEGEADLNKLLGTVVRYPITAGEPVTHGGLVSPGDRGFLACGARPRHARDHRSGVGQDRRRRLRVPGRPGRHHAHAVG